MLDSLNVLCLKAFLALSDIEADALAFGQGFEACTNDGAEVSKNV